jgi:hypothetical protein
VPCTPFSLAAQATHPLTTQGKVNKAVARPKSSVRYALRLANTNTAKGSPAVPLDVTVTLPANATTYKSSRVSPALKPKQAPTQTVVDGLTVLTWRNVVVKAGGKRAVFVNFKVAADAPNGHVISVGATYTRTAGPDAPYCPTDARPPR